MVSICNTAYWFIYTCFIVLLSQYMMRVCSSNQAGSWNITQISHSHCCEINFKLYYLPWRLSRRNVTRKILAPKPHQKTLWIHPTPWFPAALLTWFEPYICMCEFKNVLYRFVTFYHVTCNDDHKNIKWLLSELVYCGTTQRSINHDTTIDI